LNWDQPCKIVLCGHLNRILWRVWNAECSIYSGECFNNHKGSANIAR
jgi:hypothetical protein